MPTISHRLFIAASARIVYDAVTSQAGLAGWWTPDAMAKPELNSIARFPFGPTYFKEMKIVELSPFSKVKWDCLAGASEWIGTQLSFEIHSGDKSSLMNAHPESIGQFQQSEADAGTLLIFNHTDWKEQSPMFSECNYTWGRFLWSLKLFCETGKGLPWPDQHHI